MPRTANLIFGLLALVALGFLYFAIQKVAREVEAVRSEQDEFVSLTDVQESIFPAILAVQKEQAAIRSEFDRRSTEKAKRSGGGVGSAAGVGAAALPCRDEGGVTVAVLSNMAQLFGDVGRCESVGTATAVLQEVAAASTRERGGEGGVLLAEDVGDSDEEDDEEEPGSVTIDEIYDAEEEEGDAKDRD